MGDNKIIYYWFLFSNTKQLQSILRLILKNTIITKIFVFEILNSQIYFNNIYQVVLL